MKWLLINIVKWFTEQIILKFFTRLSLVKNSAVYQDLTDESIIIHKKGILLWFNQTTCTMFGYTENELKGMNGLNSLVFPEDIPKVAEKIKNKNEAPYNVRVIHKNGDIIEVDVKTKNTSFKGENARVVVLNDMTQKNKLVRNLEKSKEELIHSKILYENTIKFLGSGLILVDINGRIISVNNSFASIIGVTVQSLKGKAIIDIINKWKWNNICNYLKKEYNDVWSGEYHIKTVDSNKFCNIYVSKVNNEEGSESIVSVIDIDEAKKNEALLIEERKKRMLSLIHGEERERMRISKELHDSLGQKLTAAKFSVGGLILNKLVDGDNMSMLSTTKEILEEAIQEVREVSQNLYPSTLSDFGLVPAINLMAERINKSKKIKCIVNVKGEMERIDQFSELNLFRICQEAFSNVVKHSNATEIRVNLSNENGVFSMQICDNGKGLNIDEIEFGNGMYNMKERASAIQADFSLKSKLNKGVEITIKVGNGK